MSKREDELLLTDILESISRIQDYMKQMKFDEFLSDLKTQDAVIRNLEIIGEACNQISNNFKKWNSQIAFQDVIDFRNRAIHQYHGMNFDFVWDIIKNDIPELKNQILEIISNS